MCTHDDCMYNNSVYVMDRVLDMTKILFISLRLGIGRTLDCCSNRLL